MNDFLDDTDMPLRCDEVDLNTLIVMRMIVKYGYLLSRCSAGKFTFSYNIKMDEDHEQNITYTLGTGISLFDNHNKYEPTIERSTYTIEKVS